MQILLFVCLFWSSVSYSVDVQSKSGMRCMSGMRGMVSRGMMHIRAVESDNLNFCVGKRIYKQTVLSPLFLKNQSHILEGWSPLVSFIDALVLFIRKK